MSLNFKSLKYKSPKSTIEDTWNDRPSFPPIASVQFTLFRAIRLAVAACSIVTWSALRYHDPFGTFFESWLGLGRVIENDLEPVREASTA